MNGATNVLHTFDQVTASAWLSYHQQNAKQAESIDELLDAMSQQHASSSTRSLAVNLFSHYTISFALKLLRDPSAARMFDLILMALAGLSCAFLTRKLVHCLKGSSRSSEPDEVLRSPQTPLDLRSPLSMVGTPKTPSSYRRPLASLQNTPLAPSPLKSLAPPPSRDATPKSGRISFGGERKPQPRATNAEEEDLIRTFEQRRLDLERSVVRPTRVFGATAEKENEDDEWSP